MNDIFTPQFPMLVNSELACLVGLEESVFLQQLHYWQLKYELVPLHQHNGKTWIYNSAESWRVQFPFWSVDKIGRITRSLRSRNLVFATQELNAYKYDKTIWYSLNYPVIEKLIFNKRAQHAEITLTAKMQNGDCKNTESNLRDCNLEAATPQDQYHRLSTETSSKNNNTGSDGVVVSSAELEKLIGMIPAEVMSAAIKTEIRQVLGKPDGYIIVESNIYYAIRNHKEKNGKTGREQSLGGYLCKAIAGDYAAETRKKSLQQKEVSEKYRESAEAINAQAEKQEAVEAADRQRRLEKLRSLPESIRLELESELDHLISIGKPIPGDIPSARESWLATLLDEGRIGRKLEQASL